MTDSPVFHWTDADGVDHAVRWRSEAGVQPPKRAVPADDRLPADWPQRRARTQARAGDRCEALLHDGSRCTARGTDCDHIKHGDDHDEANLQWLCPWHHKRKTQLEARAELDAIRAANLPRPRQHPGLTM